jgi:type IV pilus assembly protein PilA
MENMGKLNSSNKPPFGEIKMRPELQAKLLQHLNKKKADGGFTLVELLVVVIIIGILAAIALPSYLNLTASSKQSEARQNLASINHAQQVWFTENSGGFASTFDQIAIGVVKGTGATSDSSAYNYQMEVNGRVLSSSGTPLTDVKLRRYAGGVYSYENAASQQSWDSAVCESVAANSVGASNKLAVMTGSGSTISCPSSSEKVKVAGK